MNTAGFTKIHEIFSRGWESARKGGGTDELVHFVSQSILKLNEELVSPKQSPSRLFKFMVRVGHLSQKRPGRSSINGPSWNAQIIKRLIPCTSSRQQQWERSELETQVLSRRKRGNRAGGHVLGEGGQKSSPRNQSSSSTSPYSGDLFVGPGRLNRSAYNTGTLAPVP